MTHGSRTTGLRTDHEFTLPVGYVDAAGRLHRHGVMRLATALDEIEPLSDSRVRANEAYFGLLLLGRVVRRLGDFSSVGPEVIAGLYAADFAYLQQFYAQINAAPAPAAMASEPFSPAPLHFSGEIETSCPHCGSELVLDLGQAESLRDRVPA